MDLGLAGKAAVVTGGSKGIGLAVTQALVAEGARVTAGARHVGEVGAGVRAVTGTDFVIEGGLVSTL